VLVTAVGFFVYGAVARHWIEFRALEIDLSLDLRAILLAALTVWATYLILIEAWRWVILGWGQSLGRPQAARIWLVSNLGRYLPGKVWSIAGLAVLASRAGVKSWAATGSAVAMQALAVGTGASVVAIAAPQTASPLQLALAGVIAVAFVWLLVSPTGVSRVVSALRPQAEFRPLDLRAAISAGLVTVLAWITYGVAFWLLANGVLANDALDLRSAIGVFAAGYIVGLLAIFAPGGVGVREAVLVALLTPRIGPGEALALAVASRLVLTLCEVVAALVVLPLSLRGKESVGDQRQ
jgi:uncharacterized membrane protein YbhN (UPF0104 family)